MNITDQEKTLFLRSCHHAIINHFDNKPLPHDMHTHLKENPTANQARGLFVTLTIEGALRGCIGCITSQDPLHQTLPYFAIQAAFNDHRFSALTKKELSHLTIKISILTPPQPIDHYSTIELGTHGIIFQLNQYQSVFLPEVAIEQGWTLETTLQHLERKAGAPINSWPTATYQIFKSIVF